MLFKSYPHTNHKAMKFVKLRVSMWIIRRKNFFNFSLLPVARLNCYAKYFTAGSSLSLIIFQVLLSPITQFIQDRRKCLPEISQGILCFGRYNRINSTVYQSVFLQFT